MALSLVQRNFPSNHRSNPKPTEPRDPGNDPEASYLHLVTAEGQLQIHTASYRGSFSGVFSEALRAAGLGSQVLVAQFLKGGVNQGADGAIKLCGGMSWIRPNINCCLTQQKDDDTEHTLNNCTHEAVEEIWQICKKHLSDGDINQMVLDEIGLAISLGYLEENDVISSLEHRPKAMDIILTGPSIPSRVISMADQVTQLRCGF